MYEIFANLLAERNLKAADVCRGTGLPSSLFSEWKRGKSCPKADKLKKIADFFGVSLDYLMTGEEPEAHTLSDSNSELLSMIRNDAYLMQMVRKMLKLNNEHDKEILMALVDAMLNKSEE